MERHQGRPKCRFNQHARHHLKKGNKQMMT
jgi:hypothetical protein